MTFVAAASSRPFGAGGAGGGFFRGSGGMRSHHGGGFVGFMMRKGMTGVKTGMKIVKMVMIDFRT